MDPVHRALIIQHLPTLLELTDCNEAFLALLQSKELLSIEEVQRIKAVGNNVGQMGQSREFYDILQRKSGSFEILLEALRVTRQSGALDLLVEVPSSDQQREQAKRFQGAPSYIKDFRNSNKTVLLVNTKHCELTCERICETNSDCRYLSFEEFLECLSGQCTSKNNALEIPVVNCENDVKSVVTNISQEKVVLVGNLEGTEANNPAYQIVNDRIAWTDLTRLTRQKILETIKANLDLDSSDCTTYLENIDNDLLVDLINGEIPNIEDLFKNTIPDPIPYYIQRSLLTRYVITTDIFSANGIDIFLVAGIEWHKLSELADGKPTVTSSDVISNGLDALTKFVHLEVGKHFERIATKLTNRPIHYLKFEGEKLFWIQSAGSMDLIQQNLELKNDQITLNEDDFLQNVSDSTSCKRNLVCIAGSPGMGKSLLLAQIARKVREGGTPDCVGFTTISEIVSKAKPAKNSSYFKDHVLNVIAESISTHPLGIAYFLKNKHKLTNLFLDALDEIHNKDMKFANSLLNILKEIFAGTRIWIATRPHMLIQLEKSMKVLGYNIQPFTEQDQINFLKLFWAKSSSEETHANMSTRLAYFANKCLNSFKSKTNSEIEHDISAIPLQCQQIGEIFKEEAIDYCRADDSSLPKFHVHSTLNLYQKLVEKKFTLFYTNYDRNHVSKQDLINAHVYYAISHLFHSYLKKLTRGIPTQNISNLTQDILDVGIMESSGENQDPKFPHRTLAEHFFAEFLVDFFSTLSKSRSFLCCLNRKVHWAHRLLFNHVLETKPVSLRLINTRGTTNLPLIKTHEFRNDTICEFLNSHLDNQNTHKFDILDNTVNVDKFRELSEACAYGGYDNIFIRFLYHASIQPNFQGVYSEQFLVICTKQAGFKMTSAVYNQHRNLNGANISDIKLRGFSLLHFAVVRGHYPLVENLVGKQGFREKISQNPDDFSTLITDCVCDSFNLDQRTLVEKIQIIKNLRNINPRLLTNRNDRGELLFLSSNLHVDLATELFCLGQYQPRDILKFIHSSLKIYNSVNYLAFFNFILDENHSDYIVDLCITTFQNSTFLHGMFQFLEPSKELLYFLKDCGVDFCNEEDDEQSALEIAVTNRRGKDCMIWLLSNADFTDEQLDKSFKDAVDAGNVNAFEALLERNYVNPNIISSVKFLNNLIENNKTYREMGDILTQLNLTLDVKTLDLESLFEKLVKTMPNQPSQWWDIWDQFVSIIENTSVDINFMKARYIVLRIVHHDGSCMDQTLPTRLFDYVKQIININERDPNGNTFLHLIPWDSIAYYSFEVWKTFCENGADPLCLNNKLETPICKLMENYTAAQSEKCLKKILYILDKLLIRDITKLSQVIVLTVKPGKLKVVTKVCQWYTKTLGRPLGSIVGKYRRKDVTLLDMALLSFDGNLLDIMINTFHCKEALQPFGGHWIHKCVEQPSPEKRHLEFITVYNIFYPDSVNSRNQSGLVPLSMKNIRPCFIEHLKKLRANIEAADKTGSTPLICAIKNNNYYVVKALVECGADLNAKAKNRITPLMMSLTMYDTRDMKRKDIFKVFIDNDADPKVQDLNGDTVLHHLPKNVPLKDFHDIVKYLLKKGLVDLFYRPNKKNQTPIHKAKQHFKGENSKAVFKLINDYRSGKNLSPKKKK